METEFFYIVVRGKDGSLVTYTEMPKEDLNPERKATTGDIFATSRDIVDEVNKQDMVARITQAVVSNLMPQPEPTVADKVKEALKDRGIDPESVKPAE